MKKLFLMVMCAMLAVSCTSVLDKKVSPKTFITDVKKIAEKSEAYAKEDIKELENMVLATALMGENVSKKTYREVLDKIKSERLERERVHAEKVANYEQAVKAAAAAAKFTVVKKEFKADKKAGEGLNTFTISTENIGSKDIKAYKMLMVINDKAGNPVAMYTITDNNLLAKGKTGIAHASSAYSKDNQAEQTIKSSKIEDFSIVIQPRSILFADGTSVEVPQDPSKK